MARKRLIKAPQPVVSSPEEEGEESGTEEEEAEHQGRTVPAPKSTSDEDGSEDDEDDDGDDDEDEKEETEKPNQPLSKPSKPDSESVKTKGKSGRKGKRAANLALSGEEDEVSVAVKKQRALVLSVGKPNAVANEEKEGEKGIDDYWKKYPHFLSSWDNANVGMKERAFSRLEMVTEEKLLELERKWKSSRKVELKVFVRRRDIIDKQTKLCLDAMKSQVT